MTQQDYIALVNQANRYSYEYYVLSAPTISDQEFDKLVMYIEGCEAEHPGWILPDSPTQTVGSDLSGNERRLITHRTPMLSCQKAQSIDDVQKWFTKTSRNLAKAYGREMKWSISDYDEHTDTNASLVLQWKFDGISCSLVYQDGVLISAATRGEKGIRGKDILSHVRRIPGIPQQLRYNGRMDLVSFRDIRHSGRIEVRGEIVCPKANLSLLSQDYTDCRTAASSVMNQALPSPDLAYMKFMPWALDAPKFRNNWCESNCQQFIWWIGFDNEKPAEGHLTLHTTPENLAADLSQFESEREALPVPVDGVVIKLDFKQHTHALGATAHHPHGSIAYKFTPAKATTTATRIEITTGETGRRTPVVHFEPVIVMGRTLKSASLGSENILQQLAIVPGSVLEVGLANDVRPTIYRVISSPTSPGPVCDCVTDATAPEESTESPEDPETPEVLAPMSPLFSESFVTAAQEATNHRAATHQDTRTQMEIDRETYRFTAPSPVESDDVPQCPSDTPALPESTAHKVLSSAIAVVSMIGVALLTTMAIAAVCFLAPMAHGAFNVRQG